MFVANNDPMTNYEQATFQLAGEGNFVGIHIPSSRWNGWANPLFTIEEVQKIAQLVNEQNEESLDDAEGWLVVTPTSVNYHYADDGEEQPMPAFLVNGKAYYAVMNDAWCWSVVGEDASEDAEAVGSQL